MNFHEYPTAFNITRHYLGKQEFDRRFPSGVRDYYMAAMDIALPHLQSPNLDDDERDSRERHVQRLTGEAVFYDLHKPYYQVHPQIVEIFTQAKTDNIPFLHLPLPCKSFALHLADSPLNTFVVSDTGRVVRSILCVVLHGVLPQGLLGKGVIGGLLLVVDTGEEGVCVQVAMPITDWGQTIEDRLADMAVGKDMEEYHSDYAIRCARLVFSVCFLLQSNNRLVEPHVLTKDIEKYFRADAVDKEKLANKAVKRRGTMGFRVGFPREHEFPLPAPPLQQQNQSIEGEKSLTCAHLRSGHWHLVRHGKGRKQAKVMWYFPTVVRPDLPFESSGHQP